MAYSQAVPVAQYLTEAGDGTGAVDAIGNYSGGGAVEFSIDTAPAPFTPQAMLIDSLIVTFPTMAGRDWSDYGQINNGLTNGIVLEHRGVSSQFFPLGNPVLNVADWANLSDQWRETQALLWFWVDFRIDPDRGLKINIAEGESLVMGLNDDFTSLSRHRVFASGIIY